MKLFVSPQSRFSEVWEASQATHLVTMLSPGAVATAPDALAAENRLHLIFHDIAEPRDGYLAPSAEQIAQFLRFGLEMNAGQTMLIHCYAGISRSTAAAYILACARLPDRGEAELAELLRQLSPSATPNPLMVALADAALGREGRMVAAIRAIGRGSEAFEGTPFCLDLDQ